MKKHVKSLLVSIALSATAIAAPPPPATPPGLDDLPDVAEMHAAVASAAPIHLYEDADGVYAPQIESTGNATGAAYAIRNHYLGPRDFAFLNKIGAHIVVLPAFVPEPRAPGKATPGYKAFKEPVNTCTTTSPPISATIAFHYTLRIVYGNVGVCNLTRPPGTTTQALSFQVWTYQYSATGAHSPAITWYKSTLHGQGMYFGQSAPDPYGNCPSTGASNTYNSSIELWSTWEGMEPEVQPDPPSPKWNSTGNDLYNSTCGNLLLDSTSYSIPTSKYRINLNASDWGRTEYFIEQQVGGTFYLHTPSRVKIASFASLNLAFDPNANGMFIGSAKSPLLLNGVPFGPPSHPGWWVINVSNISNSWY